MNKIFPVSRLLFAIAIAVFGIQHLIYAHFSLEPWPDWLPGHSFLAYVAGVLLIAIAFSIAIQKKDLLATGLLGLFYLLNALLLHLPRAIADLHNGNEWTGCFEALGIGASSLILAGIVRHRQILAGPAAGAPAGFAPFSEDVPGSAWIQIIDRLVAAAPFLFAVCLFVYALLHFIYADYIATIISSWIPFRLFWSWFVGFAFLASALSIMTRKKARLAAMLMGLMYYIWVAILHLPRVIASPQNEAEWTSMFVALAIGSGAWLLSRVMPE
jgi:uncharacterized membrane protein